MHRLPYLLHLLFILIAWPTTTRAGGFSKINTASLEINVSGKSTLEQSVHYQDRVFYASGPVEKEDTLYVKHIRRKAKLSKFLGLGSIGGLLLSAVCIAVVPLAIVAGVASLASGITAIVIGKEVIDNTTDRKALSDARFGLITGTIDIVTIISAVVIVALAILVAKVVAKAIGDFFIGIFGGLR